jgi:hypothetical protein
MRLKVESIFNFEQKYKDILENIEDWVYLRIAVGNELKNSYNKQIISNKNYKIKRILKKFKRFKNIFYGFKNWFKKYDHIFFSDSSERRFIDNSYKDKISDDIIDRLDNCLLIELPNPNHYKNVYTKYIVSQSLLDFLIFIFSSFLKLFISIENKQLENIFKKEKISINYKKITLKIKTETGFYKLLFLIYKPKAIFINCAYCRFGVVKAAKDLGIKVIELQHGVINKAHYGYVSDIKLNKNYIPDILLSFGLYEITIKNLLIEKVVPIGSYYLNYLKNNFKTDKTLNSIIKRYKYSVGISLQDQDWEYNGMLSFIKNLSSKNLDVLYILIPRHRKDKLPLSKNIILCDRLDCYNIIMHCNVHMSLYSSCALEAPSLGVPNILININNFAKLYYNEMLDKYHTKIVSSAEEVLKYLPKITSLEKEKIILKNEKIFVSNYEERINDFIKNYLIRENKK